MQRLGSPSTPMCPPFPYVPEIGMNTNQTLLREEGKHAPPVRRAHQLPHASSRSIRPRCHFRGNVPIFYGSHTPEIHVNRSFNIYYRCIITTKERNAC